MPSPTLFFLVCVDTFELWVALCCVVWALSFLPSLLFRYVAVVGLLPARSAVPSVRPSSPPPALGLCTPSSTSWAVPSPASCCPAPSLSSSGKMWVLDQTVRTPQRRLLMRLVQTTAVTTAAFAVTHVGVHRLLTRNLWLTVLKGSISLVHVMIWLTKQYRVWYLICGDKGVKSFPQNMDDVFRLMHLNENLDHSLANDGLDAFEVIMLV